MKTGPMKATAHERSVAEGVEIGEDANPVDDDHRPRFRMFELRQAHRPRQLEVTQTLGDSSEVIGVRLMRCEQEACRGQLHQQIGESGQQYRFVRRPGRSRHDRERITRRRRETREGFARAVDAFGALRDTIVARVPGDGDRFRARAQ